MSTSAGIVTGLLIGLVTGGLGTAFGLWLSRGQRWRRAPIPLPAPEPLDSAVLERVSIAVVALDSSDDVLLTNRSARDLGLVGRRGLLEPLLEIARSGRQSGETSREVSLPADGFPVRAMDVRVRAIPLPERVVALLIEDVTETRRVETVRRDFVANVSHEIKTPVGALALLAEAALEALDDGLDDRADDRVEVRDDEGVRHFLRRIQHESGRLARLVTELLDLSRVQGAEARPPLLPVRLDDVLAEAVDRSAMAADARNIGIVVGEPSHAVVLGAERQLVTAVANLLDNAIAYSPEGTRVALGVRRHDDAWELMVTDQGVGIPEADLTRIFERFYRVDPARSRATGGTGLGLAIVKHVVRNHGGEVRVWSSLGEGSTFTVRLPAVWGEPGSPGGQATEDSPAATTDHPPAQPRSAAGLGRPVRPHPEGVR